MNTGTTVVHTSAPGFTNAVPINRPLRNVAGSRGLAMTQVACGGILILLELIGFGIGIRAIDLMNRTGAGIWSGILFMSTGGVGILATRPPATNGNRRNLFTSFLALSIISSIQAGGMVIFSGVAMVLGNFDIWCPSASSQYDNCNYLSRYGDAFMAIRIMSLLIYFTLFIVCIVAAAFGCCNVCGSSGAVVSSQQFVYTTTYPGAPQNVPYNYGPPVTGQVPIHFISGPRQYYVESELGGRYEQPPVYEPPVRDTQNLVMPEKE